MSPNFLICKTAEQPPSQGASEGQKDIKSPSQGLRSVWHILNARNYSNLFFTVVPEVFGLELNCEAQSS